MKNGPKEKEVERTTPRKDTRKGDDTKTTHQRDRLRSKLTGNVYEVKKITSKMIVLESLNRTSQVLTELSNIALFYDREPKKDEDQG